MTVQTRTIPVQKPGQRREPFQYWLPLAHNDSSEYVRRNSSSVTKNGDKSHFRGEPLIASANSLNPRGFDFMKLLLTKRPQIIEHTQIVPLLWVDLPQFDTPTFRDLTLVSTTTESVGAPSGSVITTTNPAISSEHRVHAESNSSLKESNPLKIANSLSGTNSNPLKKVNENSSNGRNSSHSQLLVKEVHGIKRSSMVNVRKASSDFNSRPLNASKSDFLVAETRNEGRSFYI
jgi:hypothetical protein